ncbi:hypothetical protein ACJJTC_010802 [Scirpophaga incertulas]
MADNCQSQFLRSLISAPGGRREPGFVLRCFVSLPLSACFGFGPVSTGPEGVPKSFRTLITTPMALRFLGIVFPALTDGFVGSSRDKGQAVGGISGYRAQSVWTGSVTGNYFLLDLESSGNKFVSFKRFVWGLGAGYRFRDFYG